MVPKTAPAKRTGDQDALEDELLKHLNTKMTENEAFTYTVVQSLGGWGPLTSSRFNAEVVQMVGQYDCKYQEKD